MTQPERERIPADYETGLYPYKKAWPVMLRAMLRRAVLRVFRRDADVNTWGEDAVCEMECKCGLTFGIGDEPHWCPRCGRGFEVIYDVVEYPRWLHPGPAGVKTHAQREAEWEQTEREASARWMRERHPLVTFPPPPAPSESASAKDVNS